MLTLFIFTCRFDSNSSKSVIRTRSKSGAMNFITNCWNFVKMLWAMKMKLYFYWPTSLLSVLNHQTNLWWSFAESEKTLKKIAHRCPITYTLITYLKILKINSNCIFKWTDHLPEPLINISMAKQWNKLLKKLRSKH